MARLKGNQETAGNTQKVVRVPQGKRKYYLGLKDNCPMASITVGGYTFQRKTEKIDRSHSEGGMFLNRFQQPGTPTYLDENDIASIKASAENCIIRMTGHNAPVAQKLAKSTFGFQALSDDIPASEFLLFLVEREVQAV
jgi:hypothetical protein